MEISHSGGFVLGAGTNFVILPSADVAIIALTNATVSGVPEALDPEFADLVQFGEVREDWYKLYGGGGGRGDQGRGEANRPPTRNVGPKRQGGEGGGGEGGRSKKQPGKMEGKGGREDTGWRGPRGGGGGEGGEGAREGAA